nr:tyrosine-type recombinase/integrase [Bacillus sp. EB600]
MDRTTINKLFQEYADKLGKEITPHDLRHFFCSHAISKGMSIRSSQSSWPFQYSYDFALYKPKQRRFNQ